MSTQPPGLKHARSTNFEVPNAIDVEEGIALFRKFHQSRPLYSNIFTDDDVELLCELFLMMRVQHDGMIMQKGDDASFSCILLDGKAVIGEGKKAFNLGAGELLGSESYFQPAARTIDVSAGQGGCGILVLNYEEIENLALEATSFDLFIKLQKLLATNSISVLRKVLGNTQAGQLKERKAVYTGMLEQVVSDEIITDKEHKLLENTRKAFKFDDKMHEACLRSIGRTPESYNASIQNQTIREETQYTTLLGTLVESKVISVDDEKALELCAKQNGITKEKHLELLATLNVAPSAFEKMKVGNNSAKQMQRDMYRRVLLAFVADKMVSKKQEEELKACRKEYKLSMEEHFAILHEMGVTKTQYEAMVKKGKNPPKITKKLAMSEEALKAEKNNLDIYKGVLQTFVADGLITANEQKELERVRKQFSISMEKHNGALYDIGCSPAKFSKMLQGSKNQIKAAENAQRHDYQKQAKMELLFTTYVKKQSEQNDRALQRLKKKHETAQRERVNQSYTLETMKIRNAKLQVTCDKQTEKILRLQETNDEREKKYNTSLFANQALLLQLDEYKKWKEILENEKALLTTELEQLKKDHADLATKITSEMKQEYDFKFKDFQVKTNTDAAKVNQFLAGESQVQMDLDESEKKRIAAEKKHKILVKKMLEKDFEHDKLKETLHSVQHHANFLEQKLILKVDEHQKLTDEHVDLRRTSHEWEEYAKNAEKKLKQQKDLFGIIVHEKVRFKRILTFLCVNFFVKTYRTGKIIKRVLMAATDENHLLQNFQHVPMTFNHTAGGQSGKDGELLSTSEQFAAAFDQNAKNDSDPDVLAYRKKRREADKIRVPRETGLQSVAVQMEMEFHELVQQIQQMKRRIEHWQATSKVFFERNLELVTKNQTTERRLQKYATDNNNLKIALAEAQRYYGDGAPHGMSPLESPRSVVRSSNASVIMSESVYSRRSHHRSKLPSQQQKNTFPIVPVSPASAAAMKRNGPTGGGRNKFNVSIKPAPEMPGFARVQSIPEQGKLDKTKFQHTPKAPMSGMGSPKMRLWTNADGNKPSTSNGDINNLASPNSVRPMRLRVKRGPSRDLELNDTSEELFLIKPADKTKQMSTPMSG